MEATLQQFLEEGLAPSTRKVYQAGLNRYLAFTGAFHLSPEPLTTEKVTLFVAFLGAEGLSVSNIQSYLAALRHNKLLSDPHGSNPSFHLSHMTLLLRGIKRHQANRGPRITRLPITASIMRRIKSTLSSGSRVYSNLLIWAACFVGLFGFLRCGEFLVPDGAEFNPQLHLSLADVSVDTSAPFWTISLLIKVSKTDQFRRGTSITIGSTNSDLCAVAALLDYLTVRGPAAGPLFCSEKGEPLRRRQFTASVQGALSASGLNGSLFNGHSFRIGAATTASIAGVPESTIKLLGRWESSVYQSYIRPSQNELAMVAPQLASSTEL